MNTRPCSVRVISKIVFARKVFVFGHCLDCRRHWCCKSFCTYHRWLPASKLSLLHLTLGMWSRFILLQSFLFFFSYYSTNSPSDWSLVSKVVIPKVRYHIFTRNSWKIKMVFLICIYYIFIHSFANTRNAMTAQFNIPSWRRQPIIWRTGQFFSWPLLFVLVFFGISFAYFFIFLLFLHSLCFPTTAIVLRTTVSKLITTPTFL